MSLEAIFRWLLELSRGQVDLGRIHIACGMPVLLDAGSDVHAVSHEVIERLRDAMLAADVVPDGLQPDEDEVASGVLVEVKSAR